MRTAHHYEVPSDRPVCTEGVSRIPDRDATPETASPSGIIERVIFPALGVSFHILATPHFAGVEMRVGASDVLLGLGLLLLTWQYFRASRSTPPGAPAASYAWLAGMFSILLWAFLRVGTFHDAPALWARIKLIGFVVLSAYFVLGSWIASTRPHSGARAVVRGFLAGAWAASLLGVLEYGAYFYFGYPIPWFPRPAALAENPNAYGVMLAAALALDLGTAEQGHLFSTRVTLAGRAVTLLAIFLSASRTAYGGLVLALPALVLFTNFRLRQLARPLITAGALFVVLFVVPPRLPELTGITLSDIGFAGSSTAGRRATPAQRKDNFAISRDQTDHGFHTRIDLFQQALRMWREQPVLGAGLGAFWRAQHARGGPNPFVNHNTALWLLSETGLVGLVFFMGGALTAVVLLVRHRQSIPLAGGIAGMMLVMLAASLGMEVAYQRYTWCFCGLGLGLVAQARARNTHGALSERDEVAERQ